MVAISRFLRLVGPRRGTFVAALGCTSLIAVSTAGQAWLTGPLVHALFRGSNQEGLTWGTIRLTQMQVALTLAIAVAIVAAIKAAARYGESLLSAHLQEATILSLRRRLYDHVLHAEPAALATWHRGDLAMRLAADVDQVRALIGPGISAGLLYLFVAFATGGLAIALDPWLGGLAVMALPFALFIITRLGRRVRSAQKEALGARSRLAGRSVESAGLQSLVLAHQARDWARESLDRAAVTSHDRSLEAQRAAARIGPAAASMASLFLALAVVGAAHRVAAGAVEPAAMISLFTALFFLYRPLLSAGGAIQNVANGLAGLDHIEAIFALPLAVDAPLAVPLSSMQRELVFRGVSAWRGERAVLHGVEFRLAAGEAVVVVGPSGAGKSTLLLTLLGHVGITAGHIEIDGVDLATATRHSRAAQFAWVPERPVLFSDTIASNVAMSSAPDLDRVRIALAEAGAEGFVEARPGGLQTALDNHGDGLSAGQRQRICIARALYRKAPVLILDEPTSALDEENAHTLGTTIDGLRGSRTTILVTHRTTTVREAHRVIVLVEGRVVADGAPAELAKRSPEFRRLFPELAGSTV